MTTMAKHRYDVGDRVEVVDHHFMAPYCGTVVDVGADPNGQPSYTVRKVEPERDFDTFVQDDLQPDESGFLDLDDIPQIRDEITDSTKRVDTLTGLHADDPAERARAANRVAFLASRLAWLETCELLRR